MYSYLQKKRFSCSERTDRRTDTKEYKYPKQYKSMSRNECPMNIGANIKNNTKGNNQYHICLLIKLPTKAITAIPQRRTYFCWD